MDVETVSFFCSLTFLWTTCLVKLHSSCISSPRVSSKHSVSETRALKREFSHLICVARIHMLSDYLAEYTIDRYWSASLST